MALIKCKECEHQISDKAGTLCPNCGYKVTKSDKKLSKIEIFLAIIIWVGIIAYFIFPDAQKALEAIGFIYLVVACAFVIIKNIVTTPNK